MTRRSKDLTDIAMKKLEYRDDKSLHTETGAYAARTIGVAESTMRRWRKEFGHATPKPKYFKKLKALEEDPDFGLKSKQATLSGRALGVRHDLSVSAVLRHMKRFDIMSLGKPSTSVDHGYDSAMASTLFESWKRPKGIDKHLEYLNGLYS